MNKITKYILIIIALLIVGGVAVWGIYFATWGVKKPAVDVPALAQCLAAKKVTMYGAYWCSHCQNQKKLFGDSFKFVPYVECTENEKLCAAKGIQGFPTWIITDATGADTKLEGEQSFESLSKASGCSLTQSAK